MSSTRFLVGLLISVSAAVVGAQSPEELRWAGDAEGGAPFVEADPARPSELVGFDVEIAGLLATGLGRSPRFVMTSFVSIDQSIDRDDADVALSGIEDTAVRRRTHAVTVPYYRFREVLAVRDADAASLRTLADFRGRRVGTLGGTIAYELLRRAAELYGLDVVTYDDDVHPYTDLTIGRVDGVLLDDVLAARRRQSMTGFTIQPGAVAIGHYVGVLAAENAPMRDKMDELLRAAMRDGTLERIFRKWNVWNDEQRALYADVLAERPVAPVVTLDPALTLDVLSPWGTTRRYLPALLRAALVTLVVSCLAMALAIVLGVAIAIGRIYGSPLVQRLLVGYVEVTRGTPILLQLFVLYYGLAAAVRLPAFMAGLLGLAFNYAAYESEIYRSALLAIPNGQLEAARTLGLNPLQILRLIRGPQAFRIALAPMTNDFVAMLKDSSLVSVLTVLELTKQTQIFATNLGSWVIPGALCAGLYLLMSLPLSAAARRLEQRWRPATS
ncbi:MAG: ABC transporter permease subunit [Vicinamibacterales bacterium]